MAVLRQTLVELTSIIKRDETRRFTEFYRLANCCLLLGMDDDARLAYQQGVLWYQDHENPSLPLCNVCRAEQTLNDPFFACKVCPDSDLCNICKEEHDKKAVLELCRDHEFLGIVASKAKFQPSDTEAFNGWLDGIMERVHRLTM